MPSLHIMVLNGHLRIADSQMVNCYTASIQDDPRLQILFATQTNEIKNNFDVQQAQRLQSASGMQINYCERLSTFLKSLKGLVPTLKRLCVYSQDSEYNLELVIQIAGLFKDDEVSFQYGQGVDKGVKCHVYLFQDYLCSDSSSEQFRLSNSYGWFNKHFKARELVRARNSDLLKRKPSASFVKQLSLKPIFSIPSGDVKYPEQTLVWKEFTRHLINYSKSREKLASLFDFSSSSSSFQSPFLSAGVISTTQLLSSISLQAPNALMKGVIKKAHEKHLDPDTDQRYSLTKLKDSVSKYRDELLWAEFCHLYWLSNKEQLCNPPTTFYVVEQSKPTHYRKLFYQHNSLVSGGLYKRNRKWTENPKLLKQFEFGTLNNEDFSIVNAAMNQLRIEGFMSNYLRMIVASFCLQQKLDWRYCLLIFEKYLIDINFPSNLFGWLFSYNLVASQPRIFSIPRQEQKRDKDRSYRSKWLK